MRTGAGKPLLVGLVVLLAGGVVAVGPETSATPPEGEIHRTDMVRAVHLADGEETVVYEVTYGPGASSGWHSHPGGVVVLVTSGTMTSYGLRGELCVGEDVSAGTAFFEPDAATAPHPHFVRNRGDVPFEAVVVAFNVPPGGAPLFDSDAPADCPDPA